MNKPIIAVIGLAVALTACAQQDALIVDGPKSFSFQRDLGDCKQLSQQRQVSNGKTIGGAVLGGLVGAGDADDKLVGAVAGAVLGAAVGRASETTEVNGQRNTIVQNCMRGRGHRVVG